MTATLLFLAINAIIAEASGWRLTSEQASISRRHVATDASGSVDEMDACFEVGLQPEASAMIVFSVRNSRVAVMAESLRTGHRPARV